VFHLKKRRRIWFLLAGAFAVLLLLFGRPIVYLIRVARNDTDQIEKPQPGYVDDVSRMNNTKVCEAWAVTAGTLAAEAALRQLLR
jgi:hypothetical protein